MTSKTMEERAEQMVAFQRHDQRAPATSETSFHAGWDAGVAWARAMERHRLQGCQHVTPCASAETCYLKTEE